MATLTLDQFLSPPTLPEEDVEMPELGGSVRIRALTKAEHQAAMKESTLQYNTKDGQKGDLDRQRFELVMVVHSMVEPQITLNDIIKLRQLPLAAIERLQHAVLRINGLSPEAQQAARATFQDGEGRNGHDQAA